MDPLLSDEQIIQRFSPLERRFLQWYEDTSDDPVHDRAFEGFQEALRQNFPDEDPDQIFDLWLVFSEKWFNRH